MTSASIAKWRKTSCTDKWVFKNQQQALHNAELMHKHDGRFVVPYRCGFCNRWHLTSRGLRHLKQE